MTRGELRDLRKKLHADVQAALDEMGRTGNSWDTYGEYVAACNRVSEIFRVLLDLPKYRDLAAWNRDFEQEGDE